GVADGILLRLLHGHLPSMPERKRAELRPRPHVFIERSQFYYPRVALKAALPAVPSMLLPSTLPEYLVPPTVKVKSAPASLPSVICTSLPSIRAVPLST